MTTETLFDPTPYGPERQRSASTAKPTIISDGTWHLLARTTGVDEYAHRYTGEQTVWGAEITRCDTYGRRIPIETGTALRPCPHCGQRA